MEITSDISFELSLGKPGISFLGTLPPERMLGYFGVVNYATNERVLSYISTHVAAYKKELLYLVVTSAGGPSGTAMSFYDTVRLLLQPELVTIGSGDVDSSGLIIFLSGGRRYVTRHTTALLHRAGRVFEGGVRYTAKDLRSMAKEDELKDKHYAEIVAARSGGKLTAQKVLALMNKNTVLTAQDMCAWGLAEHVIE